MPLANKKAKKVLFHACCAPCLTYSIEKLEQEGYDVTVYFYNPNIHPESEYNQRLDELVKYCDNKGYELIVDNKDVEGWYKITQSLKEEKEGGKRCSVCFGMRLGETAKRAKTEGCDAFCTTLTISPHKNSTVINAIGRKIAKDYDVEFIEENFKKNDGFKKSLVISKNHNMFRQTYCGCEYSIRK